ncbi:MAG: hypothetical protein UMR38_06615 [Candidatus Izemoplasma sp.]|nr:hypothetical protein [Candidatus Izemoplasma sp.]
MIEAQIEQEQDHPFSWVLGVRKISKALTPFFIVITIFIVGLQLIGIIIDEQTVTNVESTIPIITFSGETIVLSNNLSTAGLTVNQSGGNSIITNASTGVKTISLPDVVIDLARKKKITLFPIKKSYQIDMIF